MSYDVVFDVAHSWPKAWILMTGLPGLLILAEALRALLQADWKPAFKTKGRPVTRREMLLFALIAGPVFGFITYLLMAEYLQTKEIYGKRAYQVVEGPVRRYQSQTQRTTTVWFKVQDQWFYLDNGRDDHYGFNNVHAPLHDGLPVRISYWPKGKLNVILKLEVAH